MPDVTDTNTYFVVSNSPTDFLVEKLHLCSWLYRVRSLRRLWTCELQEVLEIGLQIKVRNGQNFECVSGGGRKLTFSVLIPWLKTDIEYVDMYQQIRNTKNARFIFNQDVEPGETFDHGMGNNGQILKFNANESFHGVDLCVFPSHAIVRKGELIFNLELPPHIPEKDGVLASFYTRVAIRVPQSSFCYHNSGLSKSMFTFAVKVNELRNFSHPEKRHTIKRVNACYCLHIVPSCFQLVFPDPKSFKNLRMLESGQYSEYVNGLPFFVQVLGRNQYQVVFNKLKEDHYSFFSVFECEHVGIVPVLIAVLINILCSILLFPIDGFSRTWLYVLLHGFVSR